MRTAIDIECSSACPFFDDFIMNLKSELPTYLSSACPFFDDFIMNLKRELPTY